MTDIISDPNRYRKAWHLFNEANKADPNFEIVDGMECPREALNAQRLEDWVLKLAPNASEALRLAARCQHICRWEIPRSSYPLDRAGYLKWRATLKAFHARKSGELMREAGYPEEIILRVQNLNLKNNFPQDLESRILEDALCLVFLEHQFAGLAAKTDEDKVLNALRKSWQKMTPAAREHALKLSFSPREQELIAKALK